MSDTPEIPEALVTIVAEAIQRNSSSKSMHTGRIPADYFKQARAAIIAMQAPEPEVTDEMIHLSVGMWREMESNNQSLEMRMQRILKAALAG